MQIFPDVLLKVHTLPCINIYPLECFHICIMDLIMILTEYLMVLNTLYCDTKIFVGCRSNCPSDEYLILDLRLQVFWDTSLSAVHMWIFCSSWQNCFCQTGLRQQYSCLIFMTGTGFLLGLPNISLKPSTLNSFPDLLMKNILARRCYNHYASLCGWYSQNNKQCWVFCQLQRFLACKKKFHFGLIRLENLAESSSYLLVNSKFDFLWLRFSIMAFFSPLLHEAQLFLYDTFPELCHGL